MKLVNVPQMTSHLLLQAKRGGARHVSLVHLSTSIRLALTLDSFPFRTRNSSSSQSINRGSPYPHLALCSPASSVFMDCAVKGKTRRIHRRRSCRVGPAAPSLREAAAVCPHLCSTSAIELTVWCKSLLFNGHGYTVYDSADGRMIFRVDNYAHKWREEALLMDSAGDVLLTVRRRRKVRLYSGR